MKVLNRKLDKSATKQSYRKVAWFYDLWSRLTESKAAKKVIELSAINNGMEILEIACGTGILFEQIVKRNPEGMNTGIDLSPDMLGKAEKRLKGKKGNYQLKKGDVLDLQFQDDTFDLVINNFMVDLMPENTFSRIAEEFYRVLKPEGSLVMSTFSLGEKRINRIWYWIANHFPSVLTGCRPVSFGVYLINSGFSIEEDLQISQNTFPAEVIKAIKI